jgi:hypothetical protein
MQGSPKGRTRMAANDAPHEVSEQVGYHTLYWNVYQH